MKTYYEKKKLTIEECLQRLETLFKSYQKDNEFNYQLLVSDSPFNQLKEKLNKLQDLEKYQKVIKDLFANHIELVVEKDKCYFKIKYSKGKEKSFTSKTFEDFWKEAFGNE